MAKNYVTVDAIQKRNSEPYDFETKIGTFQLRRLTHGEARMLTNKYLDAATGRIENFTDFLEEVVILGCVTPAWTPESLAAFADDENVFTDVGVHLGRRAGILATPPEVAPDPNDGTAPTGSASSS